MEREAAGLCAPAGGGPLPHRLLQGAPAHFLLPPGARCGGSRVDRPALTAPWDTGRRSTRTSTRWRPGSRTLRGGWSAPRLGGPTPPRPRPRPACCRPPTASRRRRAGWRPGTGRRGSPPPATPERCPATAYCSPEVEGPTRSWRRAPQAGTRRQPAT